MTGREIIQYILRYRLEDENIFSWAMNGNNEALVGILGLIDLDQAAVKFNVGESTIRSWIGLGWLNSIVIDNKIYISAYAEDPRHLRGGDTK